jgi:chromosome segregation ATPase
MKPAGGFTMDNELLEAIRGVMKSELQPIAADISDLKEGYTELKEDVAAMKEDISEMKEDISGLKEGYAELKEEVSTMKVDISEMKVDISDLKEDVSELKEESVLTNRRVLNIANDMQKLLGIVTRSEYEQNKKLQAIIDAQVGYEETHKRHEPRIIKLEKEVDLLDTKVRSLRAAK